jgi:2-oxoisovalerate dehydrogenase E1 component
MNSRSLGLAIGMAQNGFVPMPEIQFLAYLHNAEDQLRGEAATLPFFSNGAIHQPDGAADCGAGLPEGLRRAFPQRQLGRRAARHSGVILAVPSNGADAARMLRECVRLAREEQRVVVFLEPIALYPMRDLHGDKDGRLDDPLSRSVRADCLGRGGVSGGGADLAIVTFGNGVYLSRQALPQIEAAGIKARIVDTRWLSPLPKGSADRGGQRVPSNILIVDETRHSGGVAEALMAHFHEAAPGVPLARLTAEDSFIATGPAYAVTMPSSDRSWRPRRGWSNEDRRPVICPGRGTYTKTELG